MISLCIYILKINEQKKITLSAHHIVQNKLSSVSGKLSQEKATEANIKNSLHISVINDPYESTFGVLKDEIKRYENISLTCARGVAMCCKNSNFASGTKKIGKNGKLYL